MGGIQATSVRADFDNLFYVNTDTERSYGTSDYAYSGVTKVVGNITNEEIAKLNAPETYLTSSYKDYASTNLYRKWKLVSGKPQLVR